jgi:hypothetical protein
MTKGIKAANIIEGGAPVEYKGKREGIRFATWGKFSTGEWVHFGWSSAETPDKAMSAARSTNPYAKELGATSVEVDGEIPIRVTKVNTQIGNKPRRVRM